MNGHMGDFFAQKRQKAVKRQLEFCSISPKTFTNCGKQLNEMVRGFFLLFYFSDKVIKLLIIAITRSFDDFSPLFYTKE